MSCYRWREHALRPAPYVLIAHWFFNPCPRPTGCKITKKTLIIKKCLFATSEFAQAFTEAFLLMNHEASVVSHAYTLSDCTSRHGTAYSYMAFPWFCKPESSVPWPVQTNAMAFDTPLSCGRNNHFQTMRNKPYAF